MTYDIHLIFCHMARRGILEQDEIKSLEFFRWMAMESCVDFAILILYEASSS